MALSGFAVAAILAAGEWRSRAWLRYVDLNQVEQSVLLHKAFDEDAEEDDVMQ